MNRVLCIFDFLKGIERTERVFFRLNLKHIRREALPLVKCMHYDDIPRSLCSMTHGSHLHWMDMEFVFVQCILYFVLTVCTYT